MELHTKSAPSPRRAAAALGLTAAAAIGLTLVSSPATAAASPPDHGTFSSHEVYVDSEVCAPEGFSVDVVQDEVGTFRVFLDPAALSRSSRSTSTTGR